ncbi:PREDICTED: osmotic avoidance abnormal protein 3 isoform X2 [Nicrophorus vespilloides]|uniref:Kinesin-like protein n=1 Tax=Nicrophorus vespilloides TaxID=110193 RepID=A0ABM1MAN7_NICVS|nr:PREDICTED: osmotic avoidance abnormal protein 3 isoform X2 [Nicrophorus vespilloides]
MAENVKVIVRCRPMNHSELTLNSKVVVKMKDCMVEIYDPNERGSALPKQFTFDSVYNQDSNTEIIYNDICYPLIESVLEGYNSTIFVYGQTGCGKSYSMEGDKSSDPPEKGIISRAFEHIFEAISVATQTKYLALVSYLEIYNEQIRDLLQPHEKLGQENKLNLKEMPNEGLQIPGLTQEPVHNVHECERYFQYGTKNRMIGATLMNQNSSRSHSIFTISIEQISHIDDKENIRKGKLNLVDLAGSERQAKTGATGDRLKEATKINLSLSALGNVISALVDGKAKHIPYRDSKLTRLLQDSLGGNTRTLMIACISPASRNYMETLSTLRYANRAKNISNKPRVNEDPKDTMLRQYQEEIEKLKKMLESRLSTPLKIDDDKHDDDDDDDDLPSKNNNRESDLDTERDRLITEYEQEMRKLKNLHEHERTEKENILKQIDVIKHEYQKKIELLQMSKGDSVNKEEILKRIAMLKASLIGGEKADDLELSDKRKRKKLASERRLSAIAHVLAKIEMNEDREILQNQYKDISQELNSKTEALRKYRLKVKSLEKEICDIQGEFETERQDYLDTIRKQEMTTQLLSQISEKIVGTLKKECNYSNLEAIKEQAVWLDDCQKYRLPEMIVHRTKLPPAGQNHNRISSSNSETSIKNWSAPNSPPNFDGNDIVGNYFKPKRATELLNQSLRMDTNHVFNTWRDFARNNKPTSSVSQSFQQRSPKKFNNYLVSSENYLKKPLRLKALPNIDKTRKDHLGPLDVV